MKHAKGILPHAFRSTDCSPPKKKRKKKKEKKREAKTGLSASMTFKIMNQSTSKYALGF